MSGNAGTDDQEALDVARILASLRGDGGLSNQASNQHASTTTNNAQYLSVPSNEPSGDIPSSNTPLRSSFSRALTLNDQQQQSPPEQNPKLGVPRRNAKFSIFEALLSQDDILLYLTTQHMEPQEMFNLYCTSRPFHYIVNKNLTSYILSSARRWARLTAFRPSMDVEPIHHSKIPGIGSNPALPSQKSGSEATASRRLLRACGTEPTPQGIYSLYDITTQLPFNNYLYLCIPDPSLRTLNLHASSSLSQDARRSNTFSTTGSTKNAGPSTAQSSSMADKQPLRHVPTFRYLRFLLRRASTFQLLIHHLAQAGHRVPPLETPAVLAKISMVMDIPTNARRLSLFRNEKYWTRRDLYVANLFLIKVDMCFTDPVDGQGETTFSRLLLSQRSLETLEAVLAKRACNTLLGTLRLWVRTWHRPAPEHRQYSILGVPAAEVGKTALEGWGVPRRANMAPPEARQPTDATEGVTPQTADAQGQQASASQPVQTAVPPHGAAATATNAASATSSTTSASVPAPAPAAAPAPERRSRLLRPDELIIVEAIRRRLPLHKHHATMMAYGYLDPVTLENLPDPGEPLRPRDTVRKNNDDTLQPPEGELKGVDADGDENMATSDNASGDADPEAMDTT